MLGLLVKDLLLVKQTGLKIIIILGLYIVIFSSSNSLSLLCTMVTMISTLLILNTFAYDELAKWNYYALSLPITKKKIILSKYLLTVLFDFIGILISILLCVIKRQLNLEAAAGLYVLAAAALILTALLLPLLFKFGTQRARIWMIIICLVPAAAVIVFGNLGLLPNGSMPSNAVVELLIWLSLPVSLLLFACSYFLSCRIFENKEI